VKRIKNLYSLKKKCKICKCPITNNSTFCRHHAQPKGKKNPHYKNGFYVNDKHSPKQYRQNNNRCIDCNTLITDNAKRCRKCEIERISLSKEEKKIRRNIYLKNRKNNDIDFRLRCNLRIRMWKVLKGNPKKETTLKLVDCTIEFLKEYLEKQFKKGMNWNNYGKWEIDHIIPCASFDLSKKSEQYKCFNYKNLQPMWSLENQIKGDKYV